MQSESIGPAVPRWAIQVDSWCNEFNVPIEFLPNILGNPKVTPMIRGYALEYNVLAKLTELLSDDEWKVNKPLLNAQSGSHDNDVLVEHLPSDTKIRIECKLSKKGSFAIGKKRHSCSVKCMRSRTLGEGMLPARSKQLRVSVDHLRNHADNYTPGEFDFVVSNLANAFYSTDEESLDYIWNADNKQEEFLHLLAPDRNISAKMIAADYYFFARSTEITPNGRGSTCKRRACKKKTTCQFVPNYPDVGFSAASGEIEAPWRNLKDIEESFRRLIDEQT